MDRRKAVLEATLHLVTLRGLHDTPMSEVAKQAEVAAGTIYHYFHSKEELIIELYKEVRSQMRKALINQSDRRAPFQQQFARYWKNLFDFFIKNPVSFKFLIQFENSPLREMIPIEKEDQPLNPFITLLEEGVENGILKNIEIDLVISMLYGSIAQIAKSHIQGSLAMDQSKLYKAIEISWKGLVNE